MAGFLECQNDVAQHMRRPQTEGSQKKGAIAQDQDSLLMLQRQVEGVLMLQGQGGGVLMLQGQGGGVLMLQGQVEGVLMFQGQGGGVLMLQGQVEGVLMLQGQGWRGSDVTGAGWRGSDVPGAGWRGPDVPGQGWRGPDVAGLNFEFKGLVDTHASMPPGIPSKASGPRMAKTLSSSAVRGGTELIPPPVFFASLLRAAALRFVTLAKDGTYLKVTKELKHDILEKLAETMYAFKAYPEKKDFEAVAKALVQTHPCLQETGSSSGWIGWKNSLKFKMGNYTTKMRQIGRVDVTVNGGKRGGYTANADPPHKGIKKPRKGEINFLPEYPEGRDDHNLEEARQVLVNEMMKTKPNGSLVKKEMDLTFALRRKEVLQNKPAISQMVFYEFTRVVGKSLQENVFDELDRFSPRLMDLFRKKKGLTSQLLAELLRHTKPIRVRLLTSKHLSLIIRQSP
ncbi:unnamed protein product [Leuciscus chuanchicus]